MDRQLLERMVGAAVLILALVVIAPAILDGPGDGTEAVPVSVPGDRVVRTVTIRPDQRAEQPPVAIQSPPARPAQKPVEPKVAAAPAPPPEAKPRPEQKPEPKPEPKPKPVAKAAPKPATTANLSGWAVQLGSFANQANAKRLSGEVAAKGYKTYLLPLKRDGRTLYRVRVGPESTRQAADELAARLKQAGYKGQVAAQSPES
ncbi:MAG: SPOR domain-containing protein [Gammaproteobacteria bacterium]